jgi:outer membrane protein assembly factor BamB
MMRSRFTPTSWLFSVSSCVLLYWAQTAGLQAEDWTEFRGPNGDGVTDKSLPTEWGPDKNIRWRTEIPGEGWSSPVVKNGRIFLTSAVPKKTSDQYALSLLILDAASGELLKTVEVMEQNEDRPAKMHKKNSHASPTPIIDGDRLFVHFGYQGTACLTRDGEVVWINRDLYFQPTHGNGGSPVLTDGHLIFTCDGDKEPKIVALDADTGTLAWSTPRPVSAKKTFSFCTPSVIDVRGQTQVVAPGSDCVLALDPQTGKTIWDVRYVGYSVVPKPTYDRGLVFISTSFDKSKMLAIRPTGSGVVTDSHVEWQVDRNIPKTPSMIAHDGLVYSISDDGIALCVESETGDVVYRKRVGGNYSASPLMADGRIYFTSEEGLTTVIEGGREYTEIASNDLQERTLASFGVVDDSILLRTADALYRIGD